MSGVKVLGKIGEEILIKRKIEIGNKNNVKKQKKKKNWVEKTYLLRFLFLLLNIIILNN